jgi:multicomponent Na+:H+ antiporter subunit F
MIPVLVVVAGALFSAAAVGAVIRIVRGPTILDRMLASDVLLTILLLVIGAEMVVNHHTRTIPVMLVLAGTAAFSTVAVARYVSQQDRRAQQNPDDAGQPRGDVPGDR